MKKEVKIIEICFFGSASVMGTIATELGYNKLVDMNDYCWVVCVNPESLEGAEHECKELGLDEFIICDRKSMKVGKPE